MRALSSNSAASFPVGVDVADPPRETREPDRRRRDVEVQILRILRGDMYREVPDARSDLFDSGVLDSLTLVDLLVRIEQELGVQLSLQDFEIETFRSAEKIAAAVTREQIASA